MQYDPDDLSKSTAFDLMAKHRRRIALRILAESGGEVAIDRLARKVVARESEKSSETVDEETYTQIQLTLLHRDLPKLADENIVEVDRTDQTVASGEHINDLIPLL